MIMLGKIVLGTAGVCIAGAGMLCSEGLVRVSVTEKQPDAHRIYVIAPAMLAPIAVRLAPLAARLSPRGVSPSPQCVMTQAGWQIQAKLPAIHAALADLRDADDFVLVDVEEPGEHVQVAKAGGAIVVDVNAPDAIVHVSAPIRALSSTIDQLAASTTLNPF